MTLEEVLPEGDYRFSFRFERADPRQFFRPTPLHDDLIAQRSRWLRTEPGQYAALLPEGEPLLEEALELAAQWGSVETESVSFSNTNPQLLARCIALGRAWEPDFLLLKATDASTALLVGGVVCFPSSWSLEEKMGHPITSIHDVVPGLNDALGSQINGFLLKLRPGVAWSRSNWGLSRTDELNQHPARGLPRLDDSIRLEEAWLRVEHQILVALPSSGGILFGIRIACHALAEIKESSQLAHRLAHALRTMPAPMAAYKGLSQAGPRLIDLLDR
jgi:hypothetical protein